MSCCRGTPPPTEPEAPRNVFKFIMVGDTAVGKSCILLQFTNKDFSPDHGVTIGIEFGTKIVTLNQQSVKLQIWDTAGQEQFNSLITSYYRGAQGIILVYDVTNSKTFQHLQKWLELCLTYSREERRAITLIGNKSDLKEKRQVTYEQGFSWAKKNNITFFETSAVSGLNVDEAFLSTAERVLQYQDGQNPPASP